MATQVSLNSGAVASAGALALQTNGTTTAVTIDTSQNVGVGTTSTTYKVNFAKAGGGGTFYNTMWQAQGTGAPVTWNIDAANKYIGSSYGGAINCENSDGAVTFYTAPSGTAAAAATLTERMRIDQSGNLGLGVTPSAWGSSFKAVQMPYAVMMNASAGGYFGSNFYYNSSGNPIYVNNGYATAYSAYTAGGAHLWLTAPSGTAGNAITWATAMVLEHNKSLALQGASSQTGTGITFPATQSASTDVNTLDDYEEGTFTPAFTSTGLTVSYGQQRAIYTKIGRTVTASIYINVSGTSGTTTNPLKITNLPFASINTAEYGFSVAFGVQQFSTYTPSAFMGTNVTEISVYRQGTVTEMTGAQLANGFYLLTITYQTNS